MFPPHTKVVRSKDSKVSIVIVSLNLTGIERASLSSTRAFLSSEGKLSPKEYSSSQCKCNVAEVKSAENIKIVNR